KFLHVTRTQDLCMHFEKLMSRVNSAVRFFRRIPEIQLEPVWPVRCRNESLLSESGDRIELHISDLILRRNVKRSPARKLRIATPIPVPAQRHPSNVCALSHVKQRNSFAALNSAMTEDSRFPRKNRSMISADPVVHGRGGEVYDNRIFHWHFAHCAHQHAFDPVI